jgi:hypothetical protein
MTASDWVIIIGAIASNVVAILTAYNKLHNQGAATHTLVNQQHKDNVDRIDQLTRALTTGGVDVPLTPGQEAKN